MDVLYAFQIVFWSCMLFFWGMSRKVTEHTRDKAYSLWVFFTVLCCACILIR